MSVVWKIYKATGKCGRAYIGVTTRTVAARYRQHVNDARNGSRFAFHFAIKKYGRDWFTIETLYECESAREAAACERAAIASHNTYAHAGCGFNLTVGGDNTGMRLTLESRSKIASASKKFIEENPDHLRKMIATYNQMGRPISDDGRRKKSEHMASRPQYERTPKIREKISKSLSGRKLSPDHAARSREFLAANRSSFYTVERNTKLSASQKELWAKPEKRAARKALMSSAPVKANHIAAMKVVGANMPDARRKKASKILTDVNRDPSVQHRKWAQRQYEKALAARIGHSRAYSFRSDRGTNKPQSQASIEKISRTKRCNSAWNAAMKMRSSTAHQLIDELAL